MDSIEVADRALTARRKTLLPWYEKQIEEAGQALAKIFKKLKEEADQPYLLTHDSFDHYCADRWGMTTRRVQQMMAGENMRLQLMDQAPEMAARVSSMKERAIREIVTTPPEQRLAVFREAISTPGKVTAAKLQKAKEKVLKEPDVDAEFAPVESAAASKFVIGDQVQGDEIIGWVRDIFVSPTSGATVYAVEEPESEEIGYFIESDLL